MTANKNRILNLVITADDFGYASQRNTAIADLFCDRKISRTTILMNGRCLEQAQALAKLHGIPVGLHFNLTEGTACGDPAVVKSLVNPKTGLFHGKFEFRDEVLKGTISPEDVQAELEAQISLYAVVFGTTPPFIDGHQHVHVIPLVAQV